jgi:hypothetical protein
MPTELLKNLFPNTTVWEWIYALLGMIFHALIKLKNIPLKKFKWKIFLEDYLIVWFISLVSIFICMGTLPQIFNGFSSLDAALIGYSSSSLLKTIFKTRKTNY